MWLEDLGGPFRGWIPRKALAPQLGAYDGKNLDVQIMDRYCIDRQGTSYMSILSQESILGRISIRQSWTPSNLLVRSSGIITSQCLKRCSALAVQLEVL